MVAKFSSHKRPAPKWVVDRIEEGWAVLDSAGETINIPIKNLPPNTKSGDTLVKHGINWYRDDAETEKRAKEIKERFERIKKRS